MATIKQIYINAGTLLRSELFICPNKRVYGKVRENIERLVMEEKMYKWNDEATKEFIDKIFLMEVN